MVLLCAKGDGGSSTGPVASACWLLEASCQIRRASSRRPYMVRNPSHVEKPWRMRYYLETEKKIQEKERGQEASRPQHMPEKARLQVIPPAPDSGCPGELSLPMEVTQVYATKSDGTLVFSNVNGVDSGR